jgi:DMSO/TMAO reductase YedYZ molybdopterin-dependent catalytic subunit
VDATATGTPIGRRIVLGMLGLGGLGVLFGSKLQDGLARVLSPKVAQFLPSGGRFRIYSVVGFLPTKAAADYRLKVTGLVDAPLDLSFADLIAMPPTTLVKDFQCVTGWRVPKVQWQGVKLADLLDAAGVQSRAKALRFISFDGEYSESLTIAQARQADVMVAYEMEHKPVSAMHGGPVRLYVASMYGYKSCKWLDSIEVVDGVHPGYWEVRGYDVDADIGRSNGRSDDPVT